MFGDVYVRVLGYVNRRDISQYPANSPHWVSGNRLLPAEVSARGLNTAGSAQNSTGRAGAGRSAGARQASDSGTAGRWGYWRRDAGVTSAARRGRRGKRT